jgi:flagellar biosynthetic protein FlhB
MAENENGQDKTHEPTQKKLDEAAKEGNIPKSQELSSFAVIASGTAALVFMNGHLADSFRQVCSMSFKVPKNIRLTVDDAQVLTVDMLNLIATACIVPLATVFFTTIFVGLVQTQGKIATKGLEWKTDKLDVVAGFKKMYLSSMPIMEFVKGVGKLVALGAVMWVAINSRLRGLPAMATYETAQLLSEMLDLAFVLVLYSLPLLMVIAAGDFAYQIWKTNNDLKMTNQEVRDERKEMEGDPIVRAARKARYRQYAMGNMLARIREADVLITNPTHYAVALRYNKEEAPAPVILAMGIDHVALKMRIEARQHDVMQIENRPLARMLYATGKLGQLIPDELYGAVAQVLSIVYKRRMRRRVRMGLPPQPPGS